MNLCTKDLFSATVDSTSGKPWRETAINKEQKATEKIGVGVNKTVQLDPPAGPMGCLGADSEYN